VWSLSGPPTRSTALASQRPIPSMSTCNKLATVLYFLFGVSFAFADGPSLSISPRVGSGIASRFDAGIGGRGGPSNAVPQFDLNFAGNAVNTSNAACTSFATCLTFTRASAETCSDVYGIVTYATSGNPCITTAGLQVFDGATNLVTYSQAAFDSEWTPQTTTIVDSNVLSPDNVNKTASTMTDTGTSATHFVLAPSITYTSGDVYVLSVYFQPGTLGFAQLTFPSAQFSGVGYADFTLTSGGCSVSHTGGTLLASGVYSNSGGWCRAWIAATATASTSGAAADIYMIPSGTSTRAPTYAGTGSTLILWGAQNEVALSSSSPVPTPYIQTSGSTASRSAASVKLVSGLSSALDVSASSVTAYTNLAPASVAGTLVDADGTSLLAKNSSNNCLTAVGATLTSSNTATWTGAVTCELSWNSGGGTITLGGTQTTDSHARIPSSPFYLGATSGLSNFCNCYIVRVQAGALTANANPIPPYPAVLAGYHTRVFYDNFTTLNTIDTGQTGNAGYNWYTILAWPNATQYGDAYASINSVPPTSNTLLSIGSGGLIISSAVHGYSLMSATANGALYNGFVINGAVGYYIESQMTANPALANLTISSWPAIWGLPVEWLDGSTGDGVFTEFDYYEMRATGSATTTPIYGLHDWDLTAGSPSGQNQISINAPTADSNPHIYGVQLTTIVENGGGSNPGIIKRYYDNVLQSTGTVEYRTGAGASPAATPANPNGTFDKVETTHFVIILSTGSDWPTTFGWLGVWTTP
jgi:hypothetical protein